jgi:exonuclease-1
MADIASADEIEGPDLRDVLDINATDEDRMIISSSSSSSSTTGPITPEDSAMIDGFGIDESFEDDVVTEACAHAKRTEIVASGWWNKWGRTKELRPSAVRIQIAIRISFASDLSDRLQKATMLRRCETTITPNGRQPGCRTRPGSARPKDKFPLSTETASRTRRTLKTGVASTGSRSILQFRIGDAPDLGQGERPDTTESRFEQFRCVLPS